MSLSLLSVRTRPIGFFVHHQGHGHAARCKAILAHLQPRPTTIFCAAPELFDEGVRSEVDVVRLPDFHGDPPRSEALGRVPSCSALDCAPLGLETLRRTMGLLAGWMAERDPVLMVVDVSAEISMLARLCSVPSVTIRMHGDRDDAAHLAAYTSSAGILAPFDELLEDASYPNHLRRRTRYVGGIIGQNAPPPGRAEARERLGMDPDRHIVVAISGHGGMGIPVAPLTVAARAMPSTQFSIVGKSYIAGHETQFPNLEERGWVKNPLDYISAADVVFSTGGDNLVHEILRVGRPLFCVPEWCYYGEQEAKARALARLGAAVYRPTWPASFGEWRTVMSELGELDLEKQTPLITPDSAERAAAYLDRLVSTLWPHPSDPVTATPAGRPHLAELPA
ncbi:MAG: glycosyl transferase [Myxococcota bacterium]